MLVARPSGSAVAHGGNPQDRAASPSTMLSYVRHTVGMRNKKN
jgi:hypothetical protein